MGNCIRILAVLLCAAAGLQAASAVDPSQVLVIVQDNTGPEAGTGGANAGQFVADYYMNARHIPAGNILHIATCVERTGTGMCCSPGESCDLTSSLAINISLSDFQTLIQAPLVALLNANGGALANSIHYIVSTYGVPITIQSRTASAITYTSLSIDSAIAALNQPVFIDPYSVNPYWSQGGFGNPSSTPAHLINLNLSPKFYAVTRLDGPTVAAATGLVDRAIAAEVNGIDARAANNYFDWQGIGSSTSSGTLNQRADATILSAYNLCVAKATWTCILNNQATSGTEIVAPVKTLFQWGWRYEPSSLTTAETVVSGAVAANLISDSGDKLRQIGANTWASYLMSKGVTAMWGTTGEPFVDQFPIGNSILNHLWRGYPWAEAAYLGTQSTNWMAMFIGDPLYLPRFKGPGGIGRGVVFKGTFK
jgi:uncharacterized protein (TIGR03790 family)